MASVELKSLTGIRGLASLYVIIYHWYSVLAKDISVGPPIIESYFKNFIGHGYLSVDMFFTLSGFVLSLSSYNSFKENISFSSYKSFMFRRFVRLFPLYILMTFVYQVLFFKSITLVFFVNLTLFQGLFPNYNNSIIPPGWSLTNEWIIYFFFPFFILFTEKLKNWFWLLLVASILILLVISFLRGHYLNWMNYNNLKNIDGFYPKISFTRGPVSILRTIVSYFLGVFAFKMYRKDRLFPFLKFTIIPLFVLLFFKGSDIIIIVLFPFFLLHIIRENFINSLLSSKPVYFLGLISYSLYINHYLFINSFLKIKKLSIINTNQFSFFFVIIGTFIFSVFTYYLIEKPIMFYFKKRILAR